VVQEALTNVARHADAERVSLTLTATDRLITADVVDDGVGFDTSEQEAEASLGLRGMVERAGLLEGRVPDDHSVVRSGLRRIPADEAGIEVVGEAGNAADAVAIATEADPDVFVMDLGLPGTSGMRRPTDPRASPRICSSRSARSRPIAPTSSTSSA
jgi:CheY-like chemotaxis protein